METNLSLVRLNTQDVSKALPITTSRIVADKFKKHHHIVLRDIRNLETELDNSLSASDRDAYKIVCIGYVDSRGRKQTEYHMNFEFYMMLAMGYNTKDAYIVKNDFVKSFRLMQTELQARAETRSISKQVRKSLTDTIKDKVSDDGNFKRYAYSNYSKLVYKVVTGMDVKKYKALHGLKEKDNVRDFFSIEEIEKIQDLESKIATYIEFSVSAGKTDKEVYQEVKNYVDSLKDK